MIRQDVEAIYSDKTQTYPQRLRSLAKAAESSFDPLELSPRCRELMAEGAVGDMFEGRAPYRPRYVVVDFAKYLRQGSRFLNIAPPADIWEAVGALMAIYAHIPGVSGMPVYGGCLDALLEPFITDEGEAEKAVRLLLTHMDRAVGDAFFHIDLAPYPSRAASIILRVTAEQQRPVPNMSLLWRPDTPDEYALAAIRCGLLSAKPSFANDAEYRRDLGDYAIVSCYNALPVGGSGMTLVRLRLHKLKADSPADLLDRALPEAIDALTELCAARMRYIAEDCAFFDNSFLAAEGLIRRDDEALIGMLGFVGLAECVNAFGIGRFGRDEAADALGEAVMDRFHSEMLKHTPPFGRYLMHAQVGIAEDTDGTPGGRIPIGDEPELYTQLRHFARMHRHCAAGCGELYRMDESVRRNPQYVLDIIKGAFAIGTRYISYYCADGDVVRVTGYLVKKSDIAALSGGGQTINDATVWAKGVTEHLGLLDRKLHG